MTVKNIHDENYFDTISLTNKIVFNKISNSVDVFIVNIIIKKVFVDINSDSRTIKFKKQIKFNSIEIVETLKRFKELAQIITKQFNSIVSIK